jgi:N-terminal acetyltransferase B complex non-catalytic subunit
MSAEQKIKTSSATGVEDRMAAIQLGVALKQMKDAYERPEVIVKGISNISNI